MLFCPVQENPFHRWNTLQNPWPPVAEHDTRAGYSRRNGLTGKDFTHFRRPIAFMADLLSVPEFIRDWMRYMNLPTGDAVSEARVRTSYIDGFFELLLPRTGGDACAHRIEPSEDDRQSIRNFVEGGGQIRLRLQIGGRGDTRQALRLRLFHSR